MLFGGGKLLCELSLILRNKGFGILVVTSERHVAEQISEDSKHTLKDFLTNNNIDFVVSKNINTDKYVLERVTKQTLGISIGAAWIFKKEFIDYFEGRLINLHGTRLPKDRGGGGFSWRILRDDHLGISLIHKIDEGVDTGEIITYEEYSYPKSIRLPIEYQNYSTDKYLSLIDRFTNDIRSGKEFNPVSQQEHLSTHWPRLSTDIHGYIDWSWKLKDLEQFIYAFDDPYRGATTFINGRKVRMKKCSATITDGPFHPFQTGIVYRITGGALCVATQDGGLVIKSLSDDGIDVIDTVEVGDRFYTPNKYLEEAKQYRAVYTPKGLKS